MTTYRVYLHLTMVGLFASGCAGSETIEPLDTEVALAASVTGEAARAIEKGRFVLPPPVDDSRQVLTEVQVREIAQFAGERMAWMIGQNLQSQHKGSIDFQHLRVCGPAYFALSPFDAVTETVPSEFVFFVGSKWIVALCDRGTPAISVSIAANATDVSRASNGVLLIPAQSLSMVGIPPEWDGALPTTPENAAILAARRTAKRVTTVPILYAPNPQTSIPQGAFWLFEIDGEVDQQGAESGATLRGRRIVVGSAAAADPRQRGEVDLYIESQNSPRSLYFEVGPSLNINLGVRAGVSITYERVSSVDGR